MPTDYQEWCRPFVRSETEFIHRIKRLQRHRAAKAAVRREEVRLEMARRMVGVVQVSVMIAIVIVLAILMLSCRRRWRARKMIKHGSVQIA